MREKGKMYVSHVTVRAPGGGFVVLKVYRAGAHLHCHVGVIGKVKEPPKFGPREPCWEIVKACLTAPGITVVEGNTYPLRRILREAGYWWDKNSKVYRRSLADARIVTAVTPQPWRGDGSWILVK